MTTKNIYTQDYSSCFEDKIGTSGISKKLLNENLKKLEKAKEKVKKDLDDKCPYLYLPYITDDLEELEEIAKKYKKFKDVVIFGTGGSSLGAEALHQLATITNKSYNSPKLHIITNIDPYNFLLRFRKMNFKETAFIIISKSGYTVETIMQFLTIMPLLKSELGEEKLKDHITLITEPGENPLRIIGKKHGLKVLDHPPKLGGRYSVFSLVGVLPALIVGLEARDFRAGAREVLEYTLNCDIKNSEPAIGAAISVGLMQSKNMNITVFLAYSDRLGSLARWYRQLWAESLGKNKTGSTPVYGMGPVDQHSQLQLWLDGPNDKLFTVLRTEKDVQTFPIQDEILDEINMPFLKNRSLADLMQSSCTATIQSLIEHKRPTRVINISEITPKSMGAIMMHFILETIFSAYLLDVNPFDQPAVEHGKKLTKHHLNNFEELDKVKY